MPIVDITAKPDVERVATARGELQIRKATYDEVVAGRVAKGDVFEAAKITALQAVKDTPRILPFCHPIPITSVQVRFEHREQVEWGRIAMEVEVKAVYRTGVEMEALTGVAAGLLTIWDMVKSLEKDDRGQYPETRIEQVTVREKRKGAGGAA